MYELVDAVNQQFKLDRKLGDQQLLILTKLAELIPNPKNPVWRISLNRLSAITHIKIRSLQRLLHDLHERGELVCLDGEGDAMAYFGRAYQIVLPEGFDKDVIAMRRAHYYAGSWMSDDERLEAEKRFEERRLPPAMTVDVKKDDEGSDIAAEGGDNLTPPGDNMTWGGASLTGGGVSLTPINKNINNHKEELENPNNNNNPPRDDVVVVDECDPAVWAACKTASMVTGAKPETFRKMGLDHYLAGYVNEAAMDYKSQMESRPGYKVSNPAAYFMGIVRCKAGNETSGSRASEIRREESTPVSSRVRAHAPGYQFQPIYPKVDGYITDKWTSFVMTHGFADRFGLSLIGELLMRIKKAIPASLGEEERNKKTDLFFERLKGSGVEKCANGATFEEIVDNCLKAVGG